MMARYGCGVTPTTRYVILGEDGAPVTGTYNGTVTVYEPVLGTPWEGCLNTYELAAGDASKIGGEVVALVYP
jgi:hypothetical protein